MNKRSIHISWISLFLLMIASRVIADVNLAPEAWVSASYEESSYPAASVNDGNMDSYWLPPCNGMDSWIWLHWSSAQALSRVIIKENDEYRDLQNLEVWAKVGGAWRSYPATINEFGRGNTVVDIPHLTSTDLKLVLKSALDNSWSYVDIAEIEVYDTQVYKLGDLKSPLLSGQYVNVQNKTVTNNYGSFCYWIEEENRSAGIRVNPAQGALVPSVPGTKVTVSGVAAINWNGPSIDNAVCNVVGSVAPLAPVGTANKNLGADTGLSCSGLYVKIWGKVVDASYEDGRFVIDDGSGLPILIDTAERIWQPAPYIAGLDYLAIEGTVQSYGTVTLFTKIGCITKL